jgi:glutathione S-transferase
MRIYHREHAGRPIRAAWTLEEAGAPYEVVRISPEQGTSAEHLARHPLGRVPVLEDDDGFIFESVAICLHIADLNPDAGLLPPPGAHDRALVYQWAVFPPAELEPPLIESAIHAERDPERAERARKKFEAGAQAVSNGLGDHEFLVGDGLTVADVIVGSALAFTSRTGMADRLPANLTAYVARLSERPAYRRALRATSG